MCKTNVASKIIGNVQARPVYECNPFLPPLTPEVKAFDKSRDESTSQSSGSGVSVAHLNLLYDSLGTEAVDCEDITGDVVRFGGSVRTDLARVDTDCLLNDEKHSVQEVDKSTLSEFHDTLFELDRERPLLQTTRGIEDSLFHLEMERDPLPLPVRSKRKTGFVADCEAEERPRAHLKTTKQLRCVDEQESHAGSHQHAATTVNQYICPHGDCRKIYATIEGLRLHNRNYHEINKPWKCFHSKCTHSFVRKSDLKLHILREHIKERPYACTVGSCTRRFVCHSELRRHLSKFHKLALPKPKKASIQRHAIPALDKLVHKAEEHYKAR